MLNLDCLIYLTISKFPLQFSIRRKENKREHLGIIFVINIERYENPNSKKKFVRNYKTLFIYYLLLWLYDHKHD